MKTSRKLAFSALTAVLVVLVAEIFAQITYHSIYDYWYRPDKLRQHTSGSWSLDENLTDVPTYLKDLAVHPYLGFVLDAEGGEKLGLGFSDGVSPQPSRDLADHLKILVLGGSVAGQIMSAPKPGDQAVLQTALEHAFSSAGIDRDIWMFNGTIHGFKQPQQLHAYAYLLTQGARFDLVINLDGFNEMTLAVFEGAHKGLHPGYPRGWDVLISRRLSPGKLRKVGRLQQIRDDQAALIKFSRDVPLARSAFIGLYLAHQLTTGERQSHALIEELEWKKQKGGLSFEEGGIPFDYDNEELVFSYLAALWRRSSTLLFQLANSNNAQYVHFFQPNQYLEGSKQLTREERDRFYIPNKGFGAAYRAAYPYFRSEIDALSTTHDWFVDASMIFVNEKETVYSDWCCHFNERGLLQLADFIAGEIVARSDSFVHGENQPE